VTRRRLQILTIGYQGVSLDNFLNTLKSASVQLLLDIRELPISRRKGFSKSALCAALEATGIGYVHERALGSPRAIRHQLREDGDLTRFFSDFREYLTTQRALLDSLAHTTTGAMALMCYERDHAECHRSVVAAALAKRARASVQHLSVPLRGNQHTPHSAHPHPRQNIPAT
jgi:uncharacterized protein (DUF488 family)